MPEVGYICPGGDAAADDLAAWGTRLRDQLSAAGHAPGREVTYGSPCDREACVDVLRSGAQLVCFFGHGDRDALLGSAHEPAIDPENLPAAAAKTLVSVACEAALGVGPAAIQSGVRAHLGWNVLLLWLASDADPYGEAIVKPLSNLGAGASVSEVADELQRSLTTIAARYRNEMATDRNARLAYYAAYAAAGQVVIHGDRHARPLATGLGSAARLAIWQGQRISRSITELLRGGKHD